MVIVPLTHLALYNKSNEVQRCIFRQVTGSGAIGWRMEPALRLVEGGSTRWGEGALRQGPALVERHVQGMKAKKWTATPIHAHVRVGGDAVWTWEQIYKVAVQSWIYLILAKRSAVEPIYSVWSPSIVPKKEPNSRLQGSWCCFQSQLCLEIVSNSAKCLPPSIPTRIPIFYPDPPAVHGQWTGWTLTASCSKSCCSGTQSYQRTCTNPAPEFGGNTCAGSATKNEACNPHVCPGSEMLFFASD